MSLQLLEAKDWFIMFDQSLVAIHDVSFLVVQGGRKVPGHYTCIFGGL